MTTTIDNDPWPDLLDRLTAATYSHCDLQIDAEVRAAAREYIACLRACIKVGSLTLEQAIADCEDQIAKGHSSGSH